MSPRRSIITDAVIVGAGPVGLFLAARLAKLGIKCLLLERRPKPFRHSRSIGIHAPSLRMLEELGLAEKLIACGVKVAKGKAYSGSVCLGELSFASCPKPYNYVLTVPQFETERILEEHIAAVLPDAIHRAAIVESIQPGETDIRMVMRGNATGDATDITAKLVIGCDGRDGMVRTRMGAAFDGGAYPDTFVMGDYRDTTDFGDEARIYLDTHGLLESFPLPGKMRRWVVQTDELKHNPEESEFDAWVKARSGVDLQGSVIGLLTSFQAAHHIASRCASGRFLLAGDAAHIMSPIGGQGMNTGWQDAWDAAEAVRAVVRDGEPVEKILSSYDTKVRHRAAAAIKRSELYMSIGRKSKYPTFRNTVLSFVLRSPLKRKIANMVTMNV